MAENIFQKRAIAYSMLAHIKTSGTFVGGPLDIFIPMVKNMLHELFSEGTSKIGESIKELCDGIYGKYNLEIPIPIMRNILLRVQEEVNKANEREDIRVFGDNAFWIERFVFEDYKEEVQRSKDDVASVQRMFKEFCKIYKLESGNDENAIFKFIEQNRADISYYLCHTEKNAEKQNTLAAQFVDTFRNTPEVFDKIKDMYLGSMLTSYLTFQPQHANLNVELVLDTNFIVSLLDLNTEESTKNCNTLIEVGKRLGYSFTVLHETIIETQGLLAFKSANLDKAIIAKNINREDIYNACDRRKLSSVDLDRITDNLIDTLTGYGFRIIHHTDQWYGKTKYSKEYSLLKELRNSDKAAFHDALAIIYVKEKRQNKAIREFDKVNCWFVNNAINHDNDHEVRDFDAITSGQELQPEIIKVDDLLNILWLSNPNLGVDGKDIVDMGITALVSYTLNSSLPKSRIIKELDENIQKYRKDYAITDTDVVRLSTRIANRQINDVQKLNTLADRDAKLFADKVKEESEKQNQIDQDRAQKIDALIKSFNDGLLSLRENKEKLTTKHNERMSELDLREAEIDKKKQEVAIKEIEITARETKENEDIRTLKEDNENKLSLLRGIWERENNTRTVNRELYIKKKMKQWHFWPLMLLFVGILLLFGVVGMWIYTIFYMTETADNWLSKMFESKMTPTFISVLVGVINVFTIFHFYNCWLNPSYETNKRNLIEKDMPKELQNITFEDFLKKVHDKSSHSV